LRGKKISDRRGQGGGGERGVTEGGGSVCPFVCVSRKVIRPSGQTVDETLHLYGQLGFARDGGYVPIIGGLIKERFLGVNILGF
jgi:hypothetical protein